VVASPHSRNASYSMAFPGVRIAPLPPRATASASTLLASVRRFAPRTRVLLPDYLTLYTF